MQNSIHPRLHFGPNNWREHIDALRNGHRFRLLSILASVLVAVLSPPAVVVLGVILLDPRSDIAVAVASLILGAVIITEIAVLRSFYRFVIRRFSSELVARVAYVERDFFDEMDTELGWLDEDAVNDGPPERDSGVEASSFSEVRT